LAASLAAIEDAPWGAWGKREKPIDARALARLLVRYAIKPGTIRLSTAETPKGYMRAAFEDAWTRYAPATPPSSRHTATTDSEEAPSESDAATATRPPQAPHVAATDRPSGPDFESEEVICGGVADKHPSIGMGESSDDEHCRVCGAGVWRFTDSGVAYCAEHWALAQHNERMAKA
jgi:hypothetical protein